MRKFILSFVSFSLFIVIPGIGFEILLRNIPNDYSLKNSFLSENSDSISVIYLGSSHTYTGIDPKVSTYSGFNAAYNSQTLKYDLKILQKFSWNKLEYIVLPLSYFTLFDNLEDGIEFWRIKNYSIYYRFFTSFNPKDYSEIFSNDNSLNYKRLIDYYYHNKTSITSSELGFSIINKKTILSENEFKEIGLNAAKRHTKKERIHLSENLRYLDKIIEFANKRGVRILLFTPPGHDSYISNLDSEQLNFTINKGIELSSKNQNIKYYNLLSDNSFNADDFFNADHLNENGAEKLTIKIDSIISSLEK
ncbi:MAG: hypothetical protein AB7G44_12430 [Bacteroidia bacterium]